MVPEHAQPKAAPTKSKEARQKKDVQPISYGSLDPFVSKQSLYDGFYTCFPDSMESTFGSNSLVASKSGQNWFRGSVGVGIQSTAFVCFRDKLSHLGINFTFLPFGQFHVMLM